MGASSAAPSTPVSPLVRDLEAIAAKLLDGSVAATPRIRGAVMNLLAAIDEEQKRPVGVRVMGG
jgi:hypothetical protein